MELQHLVTDVPLIAAIAVFALLPAICEEVAFRGAMLGGLLPRRQSGERTDYEGIIEAIVISAMFFGVVHGILQQSINAALLGCLLGFLAVRTSSLYPCMAYHFTHNAGAIAEISHLPSLLSFSLGVVAVFCMRKQSKPNTDICLPRP